MKRLVHLYKQSYSGLSPATWGLSAVMLINRCGTMVVPFMTLYMTRSLGFPLWKAGLVVSIFGLGAVAGGFLGGWAAGRIGFQKVQLAALTGGGALFFLLGEMRLYPAICVTAFLLSIVNEAFRPANSLAIAAYSLSENRTRSYSLNRLSINLGWALGASLGGLIAAYNYHLLFWIDGCTNVFAALLLFLFLRPGKFRPVRTDNSPEQLTQPGTSAYRDQNFLVFSCCNLLYAVCFFQLFSTLPVFYRDHLALSERTIGRLMALNGLIIAALEMVLVFRLEGRRPPLYYIVPGTLLVALSFAVFNFLPPLLWVGILSTLLVTFGEIFSMPFMNTYWLGRSGNLNRGQYAGIYTATWASAQVIGPAAGSWLADALGYTALWWTVGSLGVTAAAGYTLLHRREKA